jgi:tRNA A37 methylthiotransferase MiaB
LAEKITPVIPKSVRSERARILTSIVKDKRRSFARKFKNRKVGVVIENASTLSGWTSENLWCSVRSPNLPSAATKKTNSTLARRSLVEMIVRDVEYDLLSADLA